MGRLRAGGEVCGSPGSASIFPLLPIMLSHKYKYIVSAHERSANIPSVKSNKNVNHQFAKTSDFGEFQSNYIRKHLFSDFSEFSITQQIYDTLIFNGLHLFCPYEALVTSSCNISKPWCKRCAKCCYVWLGFQTYLASRDTKIKVQLDETFGGENLLDVEENLIFFEQMTGFHENNAFECVGAIDETRIMLTILIKLGWKGRFIDAYKLSSNVLAEPELSQLVYKYTDIDNDNRHIPHALRGPLSDLLHEIKLHALEFFHQMDIKVEK